jgi:hypothetical protein
MTTPLASLAARRQASLDKQILELQVPRWEGIDIWVRYKPLPHKDIRGAIFAVENAKKDKAQVELDKMTGLLVKACVAVYEKRDGKELSLSPKSADGEFTVFDPDLADALELPEYERSAVQTCQNLFITDGDLNAHSNQLIEFSGYSNVQADSDLEGE